MASIGRDEAIEAIRNGLKRRSGKQWSVTGGRGTAWGWIKISVPPRRLGCARFHDWSGFHCLTCGEVVERNGECRAHKCTDTCYRRYITPEDRAELAELLGLEYVHAQGVSIAASNAHYTEYVARAAGIEAPTVVGTPYWD